MRLLQLLRRRRFGPLVSVVIPVFNGSRYLGAALESLLAQTYQNIEIIIVNDGSNDGGATTAIVRRYQRWPWRRIRYFEKPNGGVASALNIGIQAMTGDYFCWLSHDDIFMPNKIERQIQINQESERHNVVFYSDYELIDAEGVVTGRAYMAPVLGDRPSIARFRGAINGCTVFIPRHAFRVAGLFDESLRYTQDYDLWDRMSSTFEFVHIPEALVRTRLHAEQGSRDSAAIVEGNSLWLAMAKRTTAQSRGFMSGSSFAFFQDFADFLDGTPYQHAAKEIRLMAVEVSTPLVSVVLPILNELHLAVRAIDSVLLQTYSNVEVIAVLDISTEGSDLNRFQDDPRVRIFRDRGGSSSSARNFGMLVARGEYVAFLDHDDWFLPSKIEMQIAAMMRAKSLISHTSYFAIYPTRGRSRARIGSGKLSGNLFPKIMTQCVIALPTVMIHRALFERDVRFPETGHLGADTLLWIDISRYHQIIGIDEPLTIVEWSDRSAAIDVDKLIVGISSIRDSYQRNAFYRKFTTEIEILAGEIERMKNYRTENALNEELVTAAFNGALA